MNRTSILFLPLMVICFLCGADIATSQQLGPILLDAAGTAGGEVANGEQRLSSALEIALLLTALSLLPAILITITSFTRIIIVLSFVRRALSVNELPPNPVLIGLALFLTLFVMAPVGEELHDKAWKPYKAGDMNLEEAGGEAWGTMRTFLVANTRPGELELFASLAERDRGGEPKHGPSHDSSEHGLGFDFGSGVIEASLKAPGSPRELGLAPLVVEDLPFTVVVPAFVLSELKTAFQMGFLLFLPFLVIDLVVSSVLLSMGMFMLPPVMISTPIKILVFVLVDGWRLISESVVTSFL